MVRLFITYFFSFVLLASITAPTYFNLIDQSCEISIVEDFGEDEEKKGKESAEDMEVKIYYLHNNSSLYIGLEKKKRIRFYSKKYASYQKKLPSPPPELLT